MNWIPVAGVQCEECGFHLWTDTDLPPEKDGTSVCVTLHCSRGIRAERDKLLQTINTPELVDFAKAVHLEAVHQRERWGVQNTNAGKTDEDWFWVIGYLAGKALHSAKAGNKEKLLHHLITTAAALNNWQCPSARRVEHAGPDFQRRRRPPSINRLPKEIFQHEHHDTDASTNPATHSMEANAASRSESNCRSANRQDCAFKHKPA
jgi:hypothetical protein